MESITFRLDRYNPVFVIRGGVTARLSRVQGGVVRQSFGNEPPKASRMQMPTVRVEEQKFLTLGRGGSLDIYGDGGVNAFINDREYR